MYEGTFATRTRADLDAILDAASNGGFGDSRLDAGARILAREELVLMRGRDPLTGKRVSKSARSSRGASVKVDIPRQDPRWRAVAKAVHVAKVAQLVAIAS